MERYMEGALDDIRDKLRIEMVTLAMEIGT
jgi:hypothetical protein